MLYVNSPVARFCYATSEVKRKVDSHLRGETLVLSNNQRFWKLFDCAASGKRTTVEELPDSDDEITWKRLAGRKRKR